MGVARALPRLFCAWPRRHPLSGAFLEGGAEGGGGLFQALGIAVPRAQCQKVSRAVNRDDRAHDQGHEKLAPGYPLGLRSQPPQCATLGGRRGSAPSTPEQRDDGAPHVPGHHGAEWPRGTRRHGPRLADRARSAGTVCKTIRVRSNCALVCRRYRPASGTSSFTMRTDVAASDPPSDSARSPRRRPIRGARG